MSAVQTVKGSTYEIRDLSLAEEGKKRIEWAARHMPVLTSLKRQFEKEKPLAGVKIGACLHVTKETGVLARTLLAAGAELHLCASNPLSTQDSVAAALVEEGISVYAWKNMDDEGYYRGVANVINARVNITIDDGGDLVGSLHKLKKNTPGKEIDIIKKVLGNDGSDLIDSVWAGAEETTTGIIRLRAMAKDGELLYPVMATNDTPTKWNFDNLWGTGQSTIDGILRGTEELICTKTVVVAGYGHCGRGVAIRAKGLGARVIITEINPHAALTAVMEGMEVMPMAEAAKLGDIFITATGCKDVIRGEHVKAMKDGAVVCNTGHFSVEINIPDLEALAVKKSTFKPMVDQYEMKDGKIITLLAEGRLVNLALATGHPSEVMDMSFSDQALAAVHVANHREELVKLGGQVVDIPEELDKHVATFKLESLGMKMDKLTEEQYNYLHGWKEGT
ncbi:MAG: adenosylhomocysteinase [Candidatus Odinarchaeota archaeon]